MSPTAREQEFLIQALKLIASHLAEAREDLQQFLDALASSTDHERWKVVGETFIEKATSLSLSENEASFYTLLGCAALGHSVFLCRLNQVGSDPVRQ